MRNKNKHQHGKSQQEKNKAAFLNKHERNSFAIYNAVMKQAPVAVSRKRKDQTIEGRSLVNNTLARFPRFETDIY